jgi:hypothetical protein
MERWIDGTALARFEDHMADVLPRVKAAAETHGGCRACRAGAVAGWHRRSR